MKKILKAALLAFFAGVIVLSTSCQKEEYNFKDMDDFGLQLHTSIAAPLVKTHSTFADIFDMESILGYLHPVEGEPINLSAASLGEIQEMLSQPMKLKDITKFNSSLLIDDIDFGDIFGEEGSVSDLDSMILIFDVVTNVPFEINLQLDFVSGINPTNDSPKIDALHNAIMVPACLSGKDKVSTTQYIKYGNICNDLSDATGMLLNLNFGIPDGTADAAISIDQYVDIKIKAYVEGTIAPTEF